MTDLVCSRRRSPHVVGTVRTSDDGALVLHYNSAVRIAATGDDRTDFEGRWITEPLATAASAFCSSCAKRYRLPTDSIARSAKGGRNRFRLQGRNAETRIRRGSIGADSQ